MAKIIRVLEHNGIIFKENECILVTLENERQVRGKLRLPINSSSLMVGEYSLSSVEIENIKHIKKIR